MNSIVELRQKMINTTPKRLRISSPIAQSVEDKIDESEELIGDDNFASVINETGEIQVGDSIYKYLNDGLYYVPEGSVDELYEYLEKNDENAVNARFRFDEMMMCGHPYRLTDVIYYFRASCEDGGGGGYIPPRTTTPPKINNHDKLAFIANLPACNKRSGILNVFGATKYCIEKFDRRTRIKTKFWSQNYFLYSSIGVVTKTQRRKFRIWWAIRSDEIQMGIYRATYTFKLNFPSIHTIAFPNKPSVVAYASNKRIHYNENTNDWVDYEGSKRASIPEFPFPHYYPVVDIHITLPKYINFDDPFSVDPDGDDDEGKRIRIFDTEIEFYKEGHEVNKMFWNATLNQIKNLLKKLNKNPNNTKVGIRMFDPNTNQFLVTIIDKTTHRTNDNKIKKTWDFSVGLRKIIIDLDGNIRWKLDEGIKTVNFKAASVDMYGVARRGSTWKGSRLIWTK